jgi:hypothetical protein
MTPARIFGRDPALILTLVATAIRLLGAFVIDLSDGQQAALNAVATAGLSFVLAKAVRREGQVPAFLGLVQALLALAIGFGLDLSAENQAVIMSFVGAAAAMFTRTQVQAPVPPSDAPTV